MCAHYQFLSLSVSSRRRRSARPVALQPSCSNIHAWPSTVAGRPSRRVGGRMWLPAIPTVRYERRKSERAERVSLSIDNDQASGRPTDGPSDGRAGGVLPVPLGRARREEGRTNRPAGPGSYLPRRRRLNGRSASLARRRRANRPTRTFCCGGRAGGRCAADERSGHLNKTSTEWRLTCAARLCWRSTIAFGAAVTYVRGASCHVGILSDANYQKPTLTTKAPGHTDNNVEATLSNATSRTILSTIITRKRKQLNRHADPRRQRQEVAQRGIGLRHTGRGHY